MLNTGRWCISSIEVKVSRSKFNSLKMTLKRNLELDLDGDREPWRWPWTLMVTLTFDRDLWPWPLTMAFDHDLWWGFIGENWKLWLIESLNYTHGQVFAMISSRKSHLPRAISRKKIIILSLITLIIGYMKSKIFLKWPFENIPTV